LLVNKSISTGIPVLPERVINAVAVEPSITREPATVNSAGGIEVSTIEIVEVLPT
jgi:hypothetical protein